MRLCDTNLRWRAACLVALLILTVTVLRLLVFNMKIKIPMVTYEGENDQSEDTRFIPEFTELSESESKSEGARAMQFMRLVGRTQGLPSTQELNNTSAAEVCNIYHSYLDNMNVLCRRHLRMGKVGDGGWEVCDDYPYRPIAPCVVYSFGINNDFSFDDDIAALYGCNVYSFDPSMSQKTYQRSEKVYFYKIGLGDSQGASQPPTGWEIKTLTQIKAMLNHQTITLDVLKMDIEFSEWPALTDMAKQGELSKIRQLYVEFHHPQGEGCTHERNRMPVLKAIEDAGFKKFYSHVNYHCARLTRKNLNYPIDRSACYEVYFINTNLARAKP